MAVGQLIVGAGNEEQFAAWNGEDGERWAANAAYYDTSVRLHHDRLMKAAAVGPTDRVLDIGCGTGQCTRDAARRALHGIALGIDLSLPMIRVAEHSARHEGVANAAFVHGDAQVHTFAADVFDVAMSRFGSIYFADQVGGFANVARALRQEGPLVVVSWRSAAQNDWISALRDALVPGAPAPEATTNAAGAFRHANHDDVVAILAAAGYENIELERLDVPINLGRDAGVAFSMLVPLFAWMVDDVDRAAATRGFERMLTALRAHETPDGVTFESAAWLITARRR